MIESLLFLLALDGALLIALAVYCRHIAHELDLLREYVIELVDKHNRLAVCTDKLIDAHNSLVDAWGEDHDRLKAAIDDGSGGDWWKLGKLPDVEE